MVWALLAASAVFWALRLTGSSPSAPPHTVPVSDSMVAHADLTRLFGAEPPPAAEAPPPAESSRFKLIGVVAPKAPGAPGIALIAVDAKPPRPFRVGATVDGETVLQSVEGRAVSLGPRGAGTAIRLELPPIPPASTGSLPPPPPLGEGMAAPAEGMAPQPISPPQAPMVQQPPVQAPMRMAPNMVNPGAVMLPNGAQALPGRMPASSPLQPQER